ncbi:MAG: thioredoxin-disulfide reductase, partial [Syntrophomonadaceae bacterium]|nr:thioredoxin-disulfide reductase [Syntrophomonadaceae bacterium]
LVSGADFSENIVDIEDGYIITGEKMNTSTAGIFAAGDVRVKKERQIATAVGDGAMAGIAVTEYLKE